MGWALCEHPCDLQDPAVCMLHERVFEKTLAEIRTTHGDASGSSVTSRFTTGWRVPSPKWHSECRDFPVKDFLRNNGLSLTLLSMFLLFLTGQTLAGYHKDNEDRFLHHLPLTSWSQYVLGSELWEAVLENWESEFLEMAAYVFLTVFLYQKGSAESKDPDKKPAKDKSSHPIRSKGLWPALYAHSLSLAFFVLFLGSFLGHVLTGTRHHNQDLNQHGLPSVGWSEYVRSSQFWFESLQNWQSEFLGVSAIVILSIWLREKDSPESKSLYSTHRQTGK